MCPGPASSGTVRAMQKIARLGLTLSVTALMAGCPAQKGGDAKGTDVAKGSETANGTAAVKAKSPASKPAAGAEKKAVAAVPKAGDIPAPADVAAPPADATVTASKLAYKIIKPGDGTTKPAEWDSVEVHYTGWTTDGKMFDSSVKRGRPARFPLKGVIAGWTEGVQLMSKGSTFRFWIPQDLAYKGRPGSPAGMLVFDVELLSIKEGNKPQPAPSDVAAPPKGAKKTASGLAYKVLKKGDGKTRPKATETVSVHYSGWTTDGKMFDSSVTRGQPASFPLNRVIAGWTEGVALMDVGAKYRFWIPQDLAYKGRPGAPAGMLVFDVELLEIKKPAK